MLTTYFGADGSLDFDLSLKDNTIYTVNLCLYLLDPAIFPASNNVLGPYFPLTTACLFIHGKYKYF